MEDAALFLKSVKPIPHAFVRGSGRGPGFLGWRRLLAEVRTLQAYHLLNENAAVMAEVAKVREQLAEDAKYNGEKCMAECDAGITFAKATNNANALARLIELKAKLTGLLVQKIDLNIENRANVAEALAEARARVLRPRSDPAHAIEGQSVALPGIEAKGATDCESRAAPYDSKVDLNL